jgi:uncharacterized OB-fold protein
MEKSVTENRRVPIHEDLLVTPVPQSNDQVHLKGSKCHSCGEVLFGKRLSCENCGSLDMEETALSKKGMLYTYTIITNRPPGDYKGPDPFVPFGIGLVELPEGCRIVAPLTLNKDEDITIGMELELIGDSLYENADGDEVVAFKFKPV